MKILMCSPDYYGIYYEINPWMHLEKPADTQLAQQQWQGLYQAILRTGISVELIQPIAGLPDMVFTANAGLPFAQCVWIARFSSPERQEESLYFKQWFEKAGFTIVNAEDDFKQPPYFEGAGDALFLGEKLIVGYGLRSQVLVYQQAFFQQFNLICCQLIDPYFYHLDTCFCPINDHLALWYPAAFSAEARRQLEASCELIAVSAVEAKQFACNAVVIDQHIMIPSGCPALSTLLEQRGFIVQACDMSEYIKAGGACKCLTLQIG